MEESSKDKLTDQELQQLSALLGRKETLLPEVSKAEQREKLQEVRSRLNMMGAFRL